MSLLNSIVEAANTFAPLIGAMLIVGVTLWLAHLLLIKRHQELGNERLFPRQLMMLGLTLVGIIAIALALPVSESSRNQVIALIGLVISGVLAFSSSTIFTNIMAGTMLRVTKPFRTGDFIEVGGFFGRVVERGLLDTEIQTENRELVALPNTFLITNPISVTRSSGCIVSTTLSLGYDIHHTRVESLLLAAAKHSELEDPFVQVLELGNYAITYKVSGMLADVKSLLTARSMLRCNILDSLHGDGIEIMSPTIMNQRPVAEDSKVIPLGKGQQLVSSRIPAETLVFDKAEKAERLEKQKQKLQHKIQTAKTDLENATAEEKEHIQTIIDSSQEALKNLNGNDLDSPVNQTASAVSSGREKND